MDGCGLLMARVARMSGYRLGQALEDLDMRGHEFAILDRLSRGGRAHGRELARTLRLHPSNLVALLDQLEADGLIARARDPRDRRRQVIALTTAGTKRLRQAEKAAADSENEMLSPLTPAEREQFRTYLERVADHGCRPGGGGWCA